ncbi:MAG: CamS family sex pheromone protein [Bacillus sp. (in: firmicutes)]
MRRISFAVLASLLVLSGCIPGNDSEQEVPVAEEEKGKAVIPKYQVSDQFYRTVLPFKVSETRGMTVSNLNSRYDINEMEMGLMKIAQENFNTDDYYFREGQYLTRSTVSKWLERKYTESQLKEKKLEEKDNLGLNPVDPGGGNVEERNEKNPLYLAHILEHDYMVQTDGDKVKLGGVVIGLAMNSVHYYQKEQYGTVYEVEINRTKLLEEGRKMAEQVLERLRNKDELKQVPITIALYEQAAKSSVVPGNFISYAHVGEGKNTISDWKSIDERYYLFPDSSTEKDHIDDHKAFLNFKQDVEEYFPNHSGVIGTGYYREDQLQQLKIEIPIQFYGKAEVVGFTQYLYGKILDHFPEYIEVEVTVNSVNGEEALIVKEADSSEPFVHFYQ